MLPNLFFISILISSSIFTPSHTQCLHHQKTLLLQLKKELTFNSSISTKLVQWTNQREDECCKWHGVECDGAGHVVSLQLDRESISGGIGDSSTLFRLTYLQKLNLAYNQLLDTPIPKGIQNLTYLTHLNLSNAVFSGQVPAGLSSLSRLVSLDVSNVYWELDGFFETLKLEQPSLEILLRNLTSLRHLYLDGVQMPFDGESKWSHIISSCLPHLVSLSLRYCSLSGPLSTSFSKLRSLSVLRLDENDLSTTGDLDMFAGFSRLTALSLVFCGLNGSLPRMMFQIPTLQNLDLSGNELLIGSLPPFNRNGSLKSLVLSETNLSGPIPSSIGNLKTLEHLDMSYCQFTGSIPSALANLTRLVRVDLSHNFFTGSLPSTLFEGLTNLVYVNLEYNSIYGSIPHSLFGLPSLLELHLSMNQFNGLVKEFPIVNVSSNIVTLDLSSNRIEGPIPDSFFRLHSLESLKLSENSFNGTFQLDKIRSLANLTFLYLSDNNLSVDVGRDYSSTFELPKLKVLSLTSCNMHDFPTFIKHSDLSRLDLSSNRIGGEIPSWIWGTKLESLNLSHNILTDVQTPYRIPPSLFFLDLQSNQLRGEMLVPLLPGNQTSRLGYLLLANNSFRGSIPASLCTATNLQVLDLSDNELSGTLPSCLLDGTMSPRLINLGRNSISGSVPDRFPLDCSLEYLDLNNNTLDGKIPKSLKRCKGLEFMNVGNNIIEGTFPCMLPSSLRVLVLNSNSFHGGIRCQKSWPNLQILDISSNNFNGGLESINFSSWKGMVVRSDAKSEHNKLGYNFSMVPKVGVRITMKGLEVELVKIFPDFTAIDFSSNNFEGTIPKSIGDLSSLRLLNLSHNAINGSIPKSFGKLRNLESLDLSRNRLMGTIPGELARLTFISVLNLSDNKLVGKIPKGSQFQTFSADSFGGNSGLCGFPLNISCSITSDGNNSPPLERENASSKGEIEWEYVSTALGYVVGLGGFVWVLIFCRSFRYKYFGKIEEVVEEIFDARDRRRRRLVRRRLVENRARRHE